MGITYRPKNQTMCVDGTSFNLHRLRINQQDQWDTVLNAPMPSWPNQSCHCSPCGSTMSKDMSQWLGSLLPQNSTQ
eukprot:9773369-Karenia_brevis.AAC.1